MIPHLEPDILECEVKWALRSITTIKVSRGDGIPAKLLQIWKDDAVKVLHSICQQIWNSAVATGLEKVSFHSSSQKGNAECSNYCITALISHTNKVMFKILQARLKQYRTEKSQMFKLDLEKAEEPEIKLPTFSGSSEKQESSRKKHLFLLHWLCQSLWLCESQ